MSRMFTCGYETVPIDSGGAGGNEQSYSFEGAEAGAVTRETTIKRSGLASRKCDTGAGNAAAYMFHTWVNRDLSLTLGVGWYWRCYFNFDSLPSSSTNMFLRLATATAGTFCGARLLTTGKVALVDSSVAQVGSDSVETVVPGQWYMVELYGMCGTGSTDEIGLRLNEVLVASATGQAYSETGIDRGYVGWSQVPGANKILYADDMALNESTGSTHNSWPGPGSVIYLNPTADSAVGGSWTAGGGATTNLYQAVDNDPPAGVAGVSATNTSQIRNSNAGDTTGNYDVVVQDYDTGGLPSTSTIRLIQPIVQHARTGAGNVAAALQSLSNPVGPELTDFVWGRGADAGTYPSAWTTRWGDAIDSPSVVRSTAPVIRVGKRNAAGTPEIAGIRMVVEYVTEKQSYYTYRRRSASR